MKNKNFTEHRLSPRKPLKTRVVFEDEFNDEFLYFLSTDLSLSGIFIETTLPFQNQTKVFLKFSLYEGDASIQVTGEIIRLSKPPPGPGRKKAEPPKGLGIRFLGLKSEDLKKIENFVGGYY